MKIEFSGKRLYSIDVYKLLEKKPHCSEEIREESINARICYTTIEPGCEAVILETPGRRELINLRLTASSESDPAGGSLSRAREYCLAKMEEWLES